MFLHRRWRAPGLLLSLVCCACGGDPVLVIDITELAPSTVIVGNDASDDVRIRLHYIDGDADIGGGTVTTYDCRNDALTSEQVFPEVASAEIVAKEIELEGELLIFLTDVTAVERAQPSQCVSFGKAALAPDELAYCMRVSDSAGHLSNATCSDTVTIVTP